MNEIEGKKFVVQQRSELKWSDKNIYYLLFPHVNLFIILLYFLEKDS